MGRSYLFECPKCGYKCRVSGGPDEGRDVSVQTIACRDCRKLHDAVVRLRIGDGRHAPATSGLRSSGSGCISPLSPPIFESAVNRLPVPEAKRGRWMTFKLRCPASATHRFQPWNDPGKCPKCGTFLEKNALPFRVWE